VVWQVECHLVMSVRKIGYCTLDRTSAGVRSYRPHHTAAKVHLHRIVNLAAAA
jgi:hypothetical protein